MPKQIKLKLRKVFFKYDKPLPKKIKGDVLVPGWGKAALANWDGTVTTSKITIDKVINPKKVLAHFTPGKPGHPDFYQILEELADLHARKNQDYSGDDPLANFKLCETAGIPAWKGVVVRLTDKMSRILTFAKKGTLEVKDEAITDTLQDMAVYAILALILYREGKKE